MMRNPWLWAVAWIAASAASATAQDATTYFRQNCTACHTIGGGRLTGPDLKDAEKRKDRAWLSAFVQNPQSKMDSGDAYALQMRDEAHGVVMPPPPGINAELTGALLDLIQAESALETSQFKGAQTSNRPFTEADVVRGSMLFRGTLALKNGGPSCIGCHAAVDVGGLGGGGLGPDLTRVFERLQGRTGTTAWLGAPGTTTMRAVFENHPLDPEEIHAMTAFLEKQSLQGEPIAPTSRLNFALLGMGGSLLGLALMNRVWKDRLRGVRRPLVQGHNPRGQA